MRSPGGRKVSCLCSGASCRLTWVLLAPTAKSVFKKPVKFTLTVMPTQMTGESSDASIPFDGKTFTVACSQTAGPTRRFRRVCEKVQAAMVNPGTVNPLSVEFLDYDNPSLSSDDTLAMHGCGASPLPSEEEGGEKGPSTATNGSPSLLYDSTDECESEDGALEDRDE